MWSLSVSFPSTQNVLPTTCIQAPLVAQNLPANAGDVGLILGSEDPLEKERATYSNILAWEIPRTKEPGGLVHGVAKESDMT